MGELVYEHSIKRYILNNPHLFIPKNSQSKVMFEKSIDFGSTICDVLIFNSINQEVGIEIKTGHDSVKRLPKQLKDYAKVCDYLWVFVHDSLLDDVIKVINQLNMPFIGIVSYFEVDGEIASGIIKEARYNSTSSSYMACMMMWSTELKVMARALAKDRKQNINRLTRKSQYIKYMLKQLDNHKVKQYLTYFILDNQSDPNKTYNDFKFGSDIVWDYSQEAKK